MLRVSDAFTKGFINQNETAGLAGAAIAAAAAIGWKTYSWK